MDQSTIENGVEDAQQHPATNDEFGGVVVDMKEHRDPDVFRALLKTSMSQQKLQSKKGVWINCQLIFQILLTLQLRLSICKRFCRRMGHRARWFMEASQMLVNGFAGSKSHMIGSWVTRDSRYSSGGFQVSPC